MCIENKNPSVMETDLFLPYDWILKARVIWKHLVRSNDSSHVIIVDTYNIRLFMNLTV